jgi:hypothetical protein
MPTFSRLEAVTAVDEPVVPGGHAHCDRHPCRSSLQQAAVQQTALDLAGKARTRCLLHLNEEILAASRRRRLMGIKKPPDFHPAALLTI